MTTENYLIGYDDDGVTSISLDNLKHIHETGNTLERVEMACDKSTTTV